MRFSGFPEAALIFYEGLEADNSKTYWTDHRSTYDEHVLAPMQALLADLGDEFGEPKIFRPYRDVRFSKDKTPYKTHIGAVLRPASGGGGRYVQVSADGLLTAGGYFGMDSSQIERYRRAVADDVPGPRLQKVVDKLLKAGHELGGERLKTTPRGYPADHPRIELLRHKGIYARRAWEPESWLQTAKALEIVRGAWRDYTPLSDWLGSNVGGSDQSR